MRSGLDKVLALFGLLSIHVSVSAQEIDLYGGFVQDSLEIGEEVNFWLRVYYPLDMEILLPDTNYNFQPYELLGREYFSTELKDGLAMDSVVYNLQSFEIDPIQYLEMTAIVLIGSDSIPLASNTDSIYFRDLEPVITDSTTLKIDLAHVDVPRQFNMPAVWIALVVLFILAVAGFLIFGSKIRRALRLRKLQKDYAAFSASIERYIRELKMTPDPETAERALTDWKVYLERLEKRPYSKHTTREILGYDDNQELQGTLKKVAARL